MFHNPYNTPIGLYSDKNVFDAFSHQTKNIINPDLAAKAKNNNQQAGMKQQQQVPLAQQAPHQQQVPLAQQAPQQQQVPLAQQAPQQPRGAASLSMRMLNSALDASEGTSSSIKAL